MSDQFGASTQQNLLTGGDGAKLYGWNLLNSGNATIADVNITNAGLLSMVATVTDDPTGATFDVPFVYQNITGDFDIDTYMVQTISGKRYGLICRDPNASAGEDWLGLVNVSSGSQTYYSNTVNSITTQYAAGGASFPYYRITRAGNVFTAYNKTNPGDSWSAVGQVITRNDFASTIQVGLYSTNDALAGNRTLFDYFEGTNAGGSASTTTALASSLNPANSGATVTFTATVTGSSPTGTVTFTDGATTLVTGTLNGSYQAAYSTSSLSAGAHSITAVYGGDSNNAGSSSTAVTEVINAVSSIDAALSLPHLSSAGSDAQTGNFCDNPLPLFTLNGNFTAEADAAVDIPVFTSTGQVSATDPCDANFKLSMFQTAGQIISGTGARANIIIPVFSVDAQPAAAANIALPIFSSDTKGTAGNISKGGLILPVITADGNIITSPLISAALSMPRFGLSNQYNTGTIGKLSYDVPVVSIAGEGGCGGVASSNLIIDIFTASGSGYGQYVGTAGNQLSLFSIEGVSVSDDSLSMYTTIVLNAATKAVSKYDGFNFNSYGRHDSGTHLAADSNGIYVIGGDSDDGQPIACSMQTGLLEFGNASLKQVLLAYFHAQAAQAPVTLKVTADGGQEFQYQFIPSNRTSRATLSRGAQGRHWEFVIEGTAPLEINSIEAAVSYLRRMR